MLNSLDWIFIKEFLKKIINEKDDRDEENRFRTIWFMKDLTDVLRTPPQHIEEDYDYDMRDLRIFWTACVYFHRFYIFHSFKTHPRFTVAVACLFLASKVEEKHLRLVDHIYVYFKVRKNIELSRKSPDFIELEKNVLVIERILLQTLNFDLTIAHPQQYFKQIISKDIKAWFASEGSKQVIRLATTLSSDSFRSILCLTYTPYQIALALVFLSLVILEYKPVNNLQSSSSSSSSSSSYKSSNTSLSNYQNTLTQSSSSVTWIEIFERDIDADILQSICYEVIELYKQIQTTNTLPFTSTTDEVLEHLTQEFSNKSTKKEIIISHSINSNTTTATTTNGSIPNNISNDGIEEYKNNNTIVNTTIYTERNQVTSNHIIHRPPVPISDFTTKISSINNNHDHLNTINNIVTSSSSSSSSDKIQNYQIYSQPNENILNTTTNNTTTNTTTTISNNNNEIIDNNDDLYNSNDDIDGNETPYDMPPPSDTPCTMGTCTPSFDYIPIINTCINNDNIHNLQQQQQQQLGKRTREEY